MLGHGGSSAGSYLADPTSPIPSHFAVIILYLKYRSASIVMTGYMLLGTLCICSFQKQKAAYSSVQTPR